MQTCAPNSHHQVLCVPNASTRDFTIMVTMLHMGPQDCMRQKLQLLWSPGRNWLIIHSLSTNNEGSCVVNQADPLNENLTPPGQATSWMWGHSHWAQAPRAPAEPRPKCRRSQEALLYPLQGETPSSAERDHSTVGNLAYHMCCKNHFYLGPTQGWVSAFSLYLPLCFI